MQTDDKSWGHVMGGTVNIQFAEDPDAMRRRARQIEKDRKRRRKAERRRIENLEAARAALLDVARNPSAAGLARVEAARALLTIMES